ncbi:histidine triad (HIT) family protein [Alkalibacterium putridalgicola]|uniref:Histidine triad (HIT) family protein n=1 Tax=Alkalibacterium putridalgicola TaxID=426703 RepID=A0A1H7SYI7_9LACT|nr:HIT family protein [Alkalibacterium putridalgicola]GEK89250.1 histidine triad protein [Alkalibacterium putridalgicola]SEL77643.1 histidine triad (HIT) family protein [Alkalibacterium putridalgicola]
MDDCIFCKIIEGDIPSRKIYEDEDVIAILDMSQVTKGHTLVISKEHVRNILDYSDELAARVFSKVPKIARAVKSFDPDCKGLNVLMNNEEIASQSVFHSHVHLLPRYDETDGFGLKWETHTNDYSDEDLDQIMHAIKKELN